MSQLLIKELNQMSKILLALVLAASVLTASVAQADESTSVSGTFDLKDKQQSPANHDVFGLNVAHDFGNTWSVEGRMEDERVVGNAGSHEGLIQLKVNKDIGTWFGVTPYAGIAVGEKSKSTTNFMYYVGEVGAKYVVTPSLTLNVQERLRTPFNENFDGHTGYNYKTWETQIGAKYAINKNNIVGVKYAVERGDSTYNTTGVSYTYKF